MDPIVLIPITLIFTVAMILGRNELVKRKLACPRKKKIAEVDVLQRFLRPDKPVRVKSCNLLPDSKKIDCGQECLRHCA